jgi:hypothetical protein
LSSKTDCVARHRLQATLRVLSGTNSPRLNRMVDREWCIAALVNRCFHGIISCSKNGRSAVVRRRLDAFV